MTLPIQYPDSSQIRHGSGTVADALGSGAGLVNYFLTTVDLRNVLSTNAAGCVTVGTSAGGIYEWDNSSSAVDDNATVIQPVDLPLTGRWIRRVAFS